MLQMRNEAQAIRILMGKFTSEDMSNTIAQILAVKEDNEMSK